MRQARGSRPIHPHEADVANRKRYAASREYTLITRRQVGLPVPKRVTLLFDAVVTSFCPKNRRVMDGGAVVTVRLCARVPRTPDVTRLLRRWRQGGKAGRILSNLQRWPAPASLLRRLRNCPAPDLGPPFAPKGALYSRCATAGGGGSGGKSNAFRERLYLFTRYYHDVRAVAARSIAHGRRGNGPFGKRHGLVP